MTRGRPPYVPTEKDRANVRAMAGFGVPEVDIAKVISVDPKTLRKHFRFELEVGHVEANAKVTASLYRRATGDGREAVIAAIFWLKCRAGWREQDKRDREVVAEQPLPQSKEERLRLAAEAANIAEWDALVGEQTSAMPQ